MKRAHIYMSKYVSICMYIHMRIFVCVYIYKQIRSTVIIVILLVLRYHVLPYIQDILDTKNR